METTVALESHLGYWLRRVSNHVSGEFARGLEERRTSVAEWVVLCQIGEREGSSPGELAANTGLTRGAVSKVVDKLEAKGWVAHTTSPEDGRVQVLSLTRQGRRTLPELGKIADQNDRAFFECLDRREKAALRRLLEKLAAQHQIRNVPVD